MGVLLRAENGSESPLLSRPPIAEEADPLSLKPGARMLPATRDDFETGESLLALFWLRGVPDAGDQPPALDLTFEITDGEARPVTTPTKLVFFGKEPSGGYRAVVRLDTASLAPGTYGLQLAAGLTGQETPPARQSVTFTLHAKNAPGPTSPSAESP